MAIRLAHIGIAVPAHAEALRFWRDHLGLPLVHLEHVQPDGVHVAMLRLGEPGPGPEAPSRAGRAGGSIELLQPDTGDNPVRRFLDGRGPGIHHLALEVDDLDELLGRLRTAGVRLIDSQPRPGAHGTRVAFVHPHGTGGVLLELVQRS